MNHGCRGDTNEVAPGGWKKVKRTRPPCPRTIRRLITLDSEVPLTANPHRSRRALTEELMPSYTMNKSPEYLATGWLHTQAASSMFVMGAECR